MNKCNKCGGRDLQTIKDLEFMIVQRCSQCGQEYSSHISPSDIPVAPAAVHPIFEVVARWTRLPTREEAEELGSQVPWMPESIDSLLAKANHSQSFSMGRLSEFEVHTRNSLFTRLGIELNLIPFLRKS